MNHLSEVKNPLSLLSNIYNQDVSLRAQHSHDAGDDTLVSLVDELLTMDLSLRESELVSDVLICVLRQAEKNVCLRLVERLAQDENAPLRLIMYIANEVIDLARPILRNSPIFSDQDLLYIIKSKGPEHWREIAQRVEFGRPVSKALIDTGDYGAILSLSQNDKISLQPDSLKAIGEVSRYHDDVALSLLDRPDIDDDVIDFLYGAVGQSVQMYIEQNFPKYRYKAQDMDSDFAFVECEDDVIEVVEASDVVHGNDNNRNSNRDTSIVSAVHLLEAGDYYGFLRDFSSASGIASDIVNQMLCQKNGHGLAISCRGLGLDKRIFMIIFMGAFTFNSADKSVDPAILRKALAYFDRLDGAPARQVLEKIRNGEVSFR